MEPTNHPFRRENDLNQTSRELWSMLIFRGVLVIVELNLVSKFRNGKSMRLKLNPEKHEANEVPSCNFVHFERWWQLKDFLFSPRKLGKMNPF